MHRREAASWHKMTLRYGVTDAWNLDSFRKMSKKDYTFDNGRSGASSAISRIDKFLVSQDVDARGGKIETAASVKKLTDHSPLLITIWGQHAAPNNTPRYFDTTHLSEEMYKAEMLQAWTGDRALPTNDRDWPAWLEAATERVMRCNARLAKVRK